MPGVLLNKVPTLTDSFDGRQPMASPLLEKDMPCATSNESCLQQDQLPDTTSEALEKLGMTQMNMLEDNCRCFSHPHENMLENGLGSLHVHDNALDDDSHLGTFRCSLARSAADLDKFLQKYMNDGDACDL